VSQVWGDVPIQGGREGGGRKATSQGKNEDFAKEGTVPPRKPKSHYHYPRGGEVKTKIKTQIKEGKADPSEESISEKGPNLKSVGAKSIQAASKPTGKFEERLKLRAVTEARPDGGKKKEIRIEKKKKT